MSDESASLIKKANKALPAWFMERMIKDVWLFGLLMRDGTLIPIRNIKNVSEAADGSIWIDVTLVVAEECEVNLGRYSKVMFSPTSARLTASVNSQHVMAAFELEDSYGRQKIRTLTRSGDTKSDRV